MKKIMLGMSGGVDSSVAALLLKEKGYDVKGATLQLHSEAEEPMKDIRDAKAVCEKIGIEHFSFDLRDEFKKFVTDNFIDEYLKARTPNPCIECNKNIKFGQMLEKALECGCDGIGTGHYARIEEKNGRWLLLKAKDLSKDQSYVLYPLSQYQLSKTVFPLGELTKSQARERAEANGFVNAEKKDSQDICFVPDGDYAVFIEKNGYESQSGDYVDIEGNILGEHKGIIRYTVGQRKGLGIALGKPAFVIEKDSFSGKVTLGDEKYLFYKKIIVEDVNFIPFDKLTGEMRVKAKLRYRHNEQPATICPYENGTVMIEFDEPQRAPSPGQSAVFYDGDIVVGGGKIVKGIR